MRTYPFHQSQPTSLQAYDTLVRERKLPPSRKAVYDVIRFKSQHNGITDAEIAQVLEWAINRVTGRRNELMAPNYIHPDRADLIQELCIRRCRVTGNFAKAWVPKARKEVQGELVF